MPVGCARCKFNVEKFFLDCDDQKKLVKCPWRQIKPMWYGCYRIIAAIYLMITVFLLFGEKPEYYFIYLTNWGYMTLTINFMIKAVVIYKYYPWLTEAVDDIGDFLVTANTQTTPLMLKMSWLLTNISTTVGGIISLSYWSMLYPKLPSGGLTYTSVLGHGINIILIFVDIAMVSIPIRMAHVYQPLTFLLSYITFSGFYWAADGVTSTGSRAIYPFTNWDDSHVATTLLACLAISCLALLFHGVMFGLCLLRDLYATKNERRSNNTLPTVTVTLPEHSL